MTEQAKFKLLNFSKSGLAVMIGAAVAVSSLMAPNPASANDTDEPENFYEAVAEVMHDAEADSAMARVADLLHIDIDEDVQVAEMSWESVPNPISLPAPKYVTPADRIPVTDPSPTGFAAMAADLPASNVGRSMSPSGIALLKELEGLELTGYVLGDGMCTIGYGHAEPLSVVSASACRQWTITEEEAEAMLREDVQIYADAVGNHFTRPLTQNQFDALTSFTYNVGVAWFDKWEWNDQPDDHSITGAMMMAVYPAKFKEGLTARRNAEIALFYLDSAGA